MSIVVKNIKKQFGDFNALSDVSLSINTGELVAILGPSGSGKTSLLRIIAGLDEPDSGSIYLDGFEAGGMAARDRKIGFVFQHYAMFRHMTVFENVAFGLRVRPRKTRPTRLEIKERVERLLRLVQLEQYMWRYPSQLSGGQRQRVALARVLAINPRVLLLDEPFGALDATVRKELRRWLRKLHDDMHVTSVLVTHDQEEAMEVADRVVVMNKGRIEQIGTPESIYANPANPFVYSFLGNANNLDCIVEGNHLEIEGLNGRLELNFAEKFSSDRKKGTVFIRPHQLAVTRMPTDPNSFKVKISSVSFTGPFVKLEAETEQQIILQIETTHEKVKELGISRGAQVFLTPKTVRFFALASGV